MHDGDWKSFTGPITNQHMSFTAQPGGYFVQQIDQDGVEVDASLYEYSPDNSQLLLHGGTNNGTYIIAFQNPITEQDESQLFYGGSRTVSTTVYYTNAATSLLITQFNATAKITVSSIGTVTVPAGTYKNCKNVLFTVAAGGKTLQASAYKLAPGVGQIEMGSYTNSSGGYSFVGWDTMTDGFVNGVDVTNLTAAPLAVQSALATGDPGLPLAQAAEAQTAPANTSAGAAASVEVVQAADGTSYLVLTGQPGVEYMIEVKEADVPETSWDPFWVGTLKEEQLALPIKAASGKRVY